MADRKFISEVQKVLLTSKICREFLLASSEKKKSWAGLEAKYEFYLLDYFLIAFSPLKSLKLM